ncbi:MAG: alpha/beta hydrolase, partial [Ferruginibacter sp.]
MKQISILLLSLLVIGLSMTSCRKKINKQTDKVYSRHMQDHIPLTIYSTPMPDDKRELNLLLFNDGQDIDSLEMAKTMENLYKQKEIGALLVVAVHAVNRMQIYGVDGIPDFQQRGSKAGAYNAFIKNELFDFIKKKAGVRSFKTVAIAGFSLGGLSAFDVAWNNTEKFDKVGVFSGSFWWRDKDISDSSYSDSLNRIMYHKIKTSRKKPKLAYWFYAGAAEETSDRDKNGVIDVIDDTKDIIQIIQKKKDGATDQIVYIESPTGK